MSLHRPTPPHLLLLSCCLPAIMFPHPLLPAAHKPPNPHNMPTPTNPTNPLPAA
jgi:hypothetical protein